MGLQKDMKQEYYFWKTYKKLKHDSRIKIEPVQIRVKFWTTFSYDSDIFICFMSTTTEAYEKTVQAFLFAFTFIFFLLLNFHFFFLLQNNFSFFLSYL